MKKIIFYLAGALIASCSLGEVVTVWSNDFSTAQTDLLATEATLGGASPTAGFDTSVWVARDGNLSFANNDLQISTGGSNVRSAGIILAASIFTEGAGTYTLTYDVAVSGIDAAEFASVHIFSGTGYNTTDSSYDMDVTRATGDTTLFTGNGPSATTAHLASSSSITSDALGNTLNFTYAGTGEIALAFEVSESMVANFDNLTVSVPEPASIGLLSTAAAFILFMRRRLSK